MTSPTSQHHETWDALTAAHRRMLEVESAILTEVIAEEDIRSLPSSIGLPTPDAALRHRNTHKGQYFGQWGDVDGQWRPIDLGPGIWFGTRDVYNRLSGQYRPDRPRTAYNGHAVKYESCRGTCPSFAIPVRCLEPLLTSRCDVYFAEGYKKALALASAGACAISLAGVDAWKVKPSPNEPGEPIEDFDALNWHGRVALITYDSDAVVKDGVMWAERRLKRELESRGAIVVVLRIPQRADGSKRGVDDYLADRLAAGDSRADALATLRNMALAELVRLSAIERRPAGGDGGETCRSCEAMREEIREYKLADRMRRERAFSTGEVEVARAYCRAVSSALSRGEREVPVWSEETTKVTGQSAATATRFHNAMRAFQADPETARSLPFHVTTATDEHGKDHIKLVVPTVPEEPGKRSTAALLVPFTHLRRPDDRASHGGARDACPKCESPMIRTTQDRCTNDDCGHVIVHPSKVVGRRPFHDETPAETVEIHGAEYVTETCWEQPFHDETKREPTYGKQDETVRTGPVSFTSYADQVAAKGPNYWGEAHPDDLAAMRAEAEEAERPKPPPLYVDDIAPDSDRPWYAKRRSHDSGHAAGGAA